MGGRALKPLGIDVRRYTTEELEPIRDDIYNLLLESGVKHVWSPQSVRSKKDHGDLDIFYVADSSVVRLLDLDEYPKRYVKNGNMIHTAWGENKDLQVDFIKIDPEIWETTVMYYDNGDLGNMIGKMCYNLGFSYGNRGLFYIYYDEDGGKEKILISNNPEKICEYLHIDLKQIRAGFDTDEDLYRFIFENPLCNPESFKLGNLTGRDRVRNRKRLHYRAFLEFLKTMPPKEVLPPLRPKLEVATSLLKNGEEVMDLAIKGISRYEKERAIRKEKAKQRRIVVAQLMDEGYSGKALGQKVQEILKSK
jgi:hypothetical protein